MRLAGILSKKEFSLDSEYMFRARRGLSNFRKHVYFQINTNSEAINGEIGKLEDPLFLCPFSMLHSEHFKWQPRQLSDGRKGNNGFISLAGMKI